MTVMCFGLQWFESLLIWLIIVGGVIALVRLLLPMALTMIGGPSGYLMSAINIIIWVAIALFVVYIIFALLECMGGGGGFPSLFPRH
jgi:hypothetical protein